MHLVFLVVKHGSVTSLQDVQYVQSYIETQLTSRDNEDAIESGLRTVETALRTISQSNQNKRKKIALEHRQAMESSQDSTSCQSMKQRLVSLAERQRTLLACFSRQKELSTKLHALKSTVSLRSRTVSIVNLTASNGEVSKSISQPPLAAKVGGTLAKGVASNNKHSYSTTGPTKLQDHSIMPNTTASNVVKPIILGSKSAVLPVSGRILPISGPSSADLAQPVPLDTLVQHSLITPGKNCITATLMVGNG